MSSDQLAHPSPLQLLLCAVLLFAPAPAGPAAAGSLGESAAGAQQPAGVQPAPAPEQATLQLPWLADGGAWARLALRLLREADTHGLAPGRYGVEQLDRRLADSADPAAGAAFERDLSVAMLRYLRDLRFGRTPSAYRAPDDTAERFDAAAYLAAALHAGRLAQAVQEAAPDLPLYRQVQASLVHYRALARLYPEWPPLPAVGAALAAGSRYAGAALLRERLRLLGDLDEADTPGAADDRYTPALAAALARFQARHGLAAHGLLDRPSLAALAVPLPHRVAQLELTLERLRWLPPLAPGPVVAVNLPTYRLWAFDSSAGDVAAPLEMRIIVGAVKTPTPLFIGQIRHLELNPYWNVPRSIVIGEILPKLARNPSYLRRNRMELVAAGGQVLGADGGAGAALRAGSVRLRQRPGEGNALGELKFAMPNPDNIYLHSTPSRELFGRPRRDLSHGCIRVERPLELAQFVLADRAKWDTAALQAAIATGRTRTLPLPAPVPVILFYATALADGAGRVQFSDDIYGKDAPLLRALQEQ